MEQFVMPISRLLGTALALCGALFSFASAEDASVTVEAESGMLGADWLSNSGSPAYITISSDNAGNNPGSDSRLATYTLTFPAADTCQLPPGIVGALTNYTAEVWVKLNSTANWGRIFDFGNNTTTYMFLTPQNGLGLTWPLASATKMD